MLHASVSLPGSEGCWQDAGKRRRLRTGTSSPGEDFYFPGLGWRVGLQTTALSGT